MNNFGIFLKSDLDTLISVMGRFYFNKKMRGNSRPGSSRVSMFSGDQEEVKIPITEQQDSRMKHLAAKAEELNEPGVREGIYTASIIYMETHGNASRGSNLNSSETVRLECGEVLGEAAGILWMSIDARERYRDMKNKISKHAFVSPFEMMEIMAANDEKEANIAPDQDRQEKSRMPRSTS